jgi:tRNA(Arg) A34 adenosine deaminase TadA/SAM-dependent methyltransferase
VADPVPDAWAGLDPVWWTCLTLAWEARVAGSVPVGALVTDAAGTVVGTGRNRSREPGTGRVGGSPLAHAEIETLLDLPPGAQHSGLTLWTSLEPCVMCAGALTVAGVDRVRFLGADALDPGSMLLAGPRRHVRWRSTDVAGPVPGRAGLLASVLAAEYFWRRAEVLRAAYRTRRPDVAAVVERLVAGDTVRAAVAAGDSLPAALARLEPALPGAGSAGGPTREVTGRRFRVGALGTRGRPRRTRVRGDRPAPPRPTSSRAPRHANGGQHPEESDMTQTLRHGDFTGLAENYSKYRTGYAPAVRSALLGLLGRPPATLDAVDVGAGTGIWTRMLAGAGFRSVTAVEPNADMRAAGQRDSAELDIRWRAGRGEATGLDTGSADLVTMASSFHWVDFEAGTAEFGRVLRPGGWFAALWSTRLLEANPLLADIEEELRRLKPGIRRAAFGRSSFTDGLTERLAAHTGFEDVVTLCGRHVEVQTVEHHLGVWRSVNDVRAELGEERFARFLDHVADRLSGSGTVTVTYLTQAWAARRRS